MKEVKKINGSSITKIEEYMLTKSPAVKTLSSLENGCIIEVKKWLHYISIENEKETEILAIKDERTGSCFSGQSETFRKNFLEAVSISEEFGCPLTLEVIKGVSRSNRSYVTCGLVD